MNEDNDIGAKAGEIWLVRCGYKAGIDGTDGAGDYPIRGWVELPDGKHAYQWCKNGRSSHIPTKRDPYALNDLVCRYDWRAELAPIWAVLKPEYRWLAMDEDTRWLGYTERPIKSRALPRFTAATGTVVRLDGLILPIPDCPWHETLTERPD